MSGTLKLPKVGQCAMLHEGCCSVQESKERMQLYTVTSMVQYKVGISEVHSGQVYIWFCFGSILVPLMSQFLVNAFKNAEPLLGLYLVLVLLVLFPW